MCGVVVLPHLALAAPGSALGIAQSSISITGWPALSLALLRVRLHCICFELNQDVILVLHSVLVSPCVEWLLRHPLIIYLCLHVRGRYGFPFLH